MCVMLLFALGTIFATIFAGLMREWILMIVGIALAVFFVMAAYWDFPDDLGRTLSGKPGPGNGHRQISAVQQAPGYSVGFLGGII